MWKKTKNSGKKQKMVEKTKNAVKKAKNECKNL